jgi:hypothetical protein
MKSASLASCSRRAKCSRRSNSKGVDQIRRLPFLSATNHLMSLHLAHHAVAHTAVRLTFSGKILHSKLMLLPK